MSPKIRNIVIAIGLLIAVVAVFQFYNQKTEPGGGVRYKLAVMLPETGNFAFIGQPIRNAIVLAHEQMKDKLLQSKVSIDLVYADTQGNPREAATQFQRVTGVEKVNGVITTLSSIVGATAPLGKDLDLLYVGLAVDPSFLQNNSNAVRVYYSFEKEGIQLADLIKERKWHKVLYLHSTDSAHNYEASKVLLPRLSSDGVSVTEDTFAVGERDFKSLCAKYGKEKWDGVIYHGYGSELPYVGEACNAYPNIASAPKLSGLSALDVKPELRANLTGVQFYAPAFLAKKSQEYEQFLKKYEARFPGSIPPYSAIYAYDAYLLIAETLIKQPTTKVDSLKKEMLIPKTALTQEYKFNDRGDFQPDSLLFEMSSDGSLKPVVSGSK